MKVRCFTEVIGIAAASGYQAPVFAARDGFSDPALSGTMHIFSLGEWFGAPGGDLDGVDDVAVAGAATLVTRQGLADVVVVEVIVAAFGEKRAGTHQHAGCAVAALQSVTADERVLQRC